MENIAVQPKAQLEASSFQQLYCNNYEETYVPVEKFISKRCHWSIGTHLDMELRQIEVVTAFLKGVVEGGIVMEFLDVGKCTESKNNICKLTKALYGLNQAPRKWNLKMDKFLRSTGFQASPDDLCFYFPRAKGNKEVMIIALYVEDLLLAGEDTTEITHVETERSSSFEMKDLSEAKICTGLEIAKSRHLRKLWLTK